MFLDVDETLEPLEKNGFTLVDFAPDSITLRFFSWRIGAPVEAIDGLTPFRSLRLERGR